MHAGSAALALQSIKPAHYFLIPPGPLLEIKDAVMQQFRRKELDILGSRNALRVFPAVISMIEQRQLL